MKFIRLHKELLALTFMVVGSTAFSQEYSAGINTKDPNPNAVLHLVSPNHNQGLLIPKLTTSDRLGMSLSDVDNGLMVYDDDEGVYYFWKTPEWTAIVSPKSGLIKNPLTGNLVAGSSAAPALNGGDNNTIIGENSGADLIGGSNNVMLGFGSNTSPTTTNSIAIGSGSFAPGDGSIAIGAASATNNPTGIALGTRAQSNAEGAIAIGSNTIARQPNSIIMGDGGINSIFKVGIGTATPRSPLQVGPNLGFFHFENNTDPTDPINAEAISDNVYPSGNQLVRNTAAPSSLFVLDNGSFEFLRVAGGSDGSVVNIGDNGDVRPSLSLESSGNAEFGGAIQLRSFQGFGGSVADDGTIQFDFANGGFLGFFNGAWHNFTFDGTSTAGSFTSDGRDNIIMGPTAGTNLASGTGGSNIVGGFSSGTTISNGSSNIILGNQAEVTDDSGSNIVLGTTSSASGGNSIAIGDNAQATAASSIAIGTGTVATNPSTIILGDGSTPYNVGIGTSNPNARLEVSTSPTSTNSALAISNSGTGEGINIKSGSGDGMLVTMDGTNTTVSGIRIIHPTSSGSSIDAGGDVTIRGNFITSPDPTVFDLDLNFGSPIPSSSRLLKIRSGSTATFNQIEPGLGEGQELLIVCMGGSITAASGGNIRLKIQQALPPTPEPHTMGPGSSLHLIWINLSGGMWVEIGRSE